MTEQEKENICKYYIQDDEKGCGFINNEMFCNRPDRFMCPVYMMIFWGKISVSEANTWMKCHQAYEYLYIRGWDTLPKMQNKNLKIGRLIHDGVEQIYNGKPHNIDYTKYFNEDDIKEVGIIKVILDKLTTLPIPTEPHITELRFELKLPDCPQINGVFDVLYAEHFDEFKATTNPDYYLTPHFLQSQLATYFLSEPKTKYCTMKIIRIPQLKSTGQHKDEQSEKFIGRIREDVDRRPGYYFIGLQDDGSWGKKFYRSEFDLDEVVRRYKMIIKERRLAIKENYYYRNEKECLYPQPCNYLQRCECGDFSELLYYRKEVK